MPREILKFCWNGTSIGFTFTWSKCWWEHIIAERNSWWEQIDPSNESNAFRYATCTNTNVLLANAPLHLLSGLPWSKGRRPFKAYCQHSKCKRYNSHATWTRTCHTISGWRWLKRNAAERKSRSLKEFELCVNSDSVSNELNYSYSHYCSHWMGRMHDRRRCKKRPHKLIMR